MLRSGHSRLYEYGYSMFVIASEELGDHLKATVVDSAYAHRIAKTSDENWKEFITETTKEYTKSPTSKEPKKKKQMSKEDHMKVIMKLKGIG